MVVELNALFGHGQTFAATQYPLYSLNNDAMCHWQETVDNDSSDIFVPLYTLLSDFNAPPRRKDDDLMKSYIRDFAGKLVFSSLEPPKGGDPVIIPDIQPDLLNKAVEELMTQGQQIDFMRAWLRQNKVKLHQP